MENISILQEESLKVQYMPLIFELYINDIVTTVQNNYNNVHIQCFVDDISVMRDLKNCLEQDFETSHKMIISKQMTLILTNVNI